MALSTGHFRSWIQRTSIKFPTCLLEASLNFILVSWCSLGGCSLGASKACHFFHVDLRLKWPFTEWETGPEQKSRKNGKGNGNGDTSEMAERWPSKWKKWPNQAKIPFSGPFFHFDRHFSAILGLGPFSIFFPIFLGFWLRARFPFCKWPPQSQMLTTR